uniref:Uncharacterized protein n=1 Tax=Anopheles dirus TaxID=7168 RepID=A0A182NXU0_9DIPT
MFHEETIILGPPALQQAVRFSDGLVWNNRPVYNYCMRGVITCFTGLRKKDELVSTAFLPRLLRPCSI